jgi:HEAT repeat protein
MDTQVDMIGQNTHDFGNASDAVKALLAVKHPVVVPFLEEALKANHAVSGYVISGLEEIGNEEAVKILTPLLEDPDPENSDFIQAKQALFAIEKRTTDPSYPRFGKSSARKSKTMMLLASSPCPHRCP